MLYDDRSGNGAKRRYGDSGGGCGDGFLTFGSILLSSAILAIAGILFLTGTGPQAQTQYVVSVSCPRGLLSDNTTLFTQKVPVCDNNGVCASLGGPSFKKELFRNVALTDAGGILTSNNCKVSYTGEPHLWSAHQSDEPDAKYASQVDIDTFLAATQK